MPLWVIPLTVRKNSSSKRIKSRVKKIRRQTAGLSTEVWEWIARITGAVAGSAIAIACLFPSSKREAILRFFTGLGIGMIFATLAGHKLAIQLGLKNIMGSIEITLIGATTASFCAWWVLGLLTKIAGRYENYPEKQNKKAL